MKSFFNEIQSLLKKFFNGTINIFGYLFRRFKKGCCCSFLELKRGYSFFLHLPGLLWKTSKSAFKQINEKTSLKWAILFALILTGSLTAQWFFLSSKKQQRPIPNKLFFSINDMKVDFKKSIKFKIVDGKFNNEVWFQKGKIFYSEQSVNRDIPYCEIDFKRTTPQPFTQSRTIKSGRSKLLDSFGIIKGSTGMSFLLVSNDFKSNPKEDFNFHYVDCHIPDKYFEKAMKIDIAYVKRITKGAVVIKRIKKKLAKPAKKSSKKKARSTASH